jgi:pimeloyl-ACP methyl ester carboxylesterase
VTDAKTFLPGLEERWSDARGERLRWFEGGSGPPVMLIHGYGGAASNWTLVAPRLLGRNRVIVPDLPGHGGSSPLPGPAERIDPYADRLVPLLGGEPAVIVGHSLGAVVALRLAVRRPDLVRGVVLAGPAGIGSSTRSAERTLTFISVVQPGKRISRLWRVVSRNAVLRKLAFGTVSVIDPRALDPHAAGGFLAGSALHTDIRSAGDALVRSDPRVDLEHVTSPALVLHGARDVQVPMRDAFEYARRLRAPLRVIADCGHLLIGERPEAVVDALFWFLDRVGHVDELPRDAELVR